MGLMEFDTHKPVTEGYKMMKPTAAKIKKA